MKSSRTSGAGLEVEVAWVARPRVTLKFCEADLVTDFDGTAVLLYALELRVVLGGPINDLCPRSALTSDVELGIRRAVGAAESRSLDGTARREGFRVTLVLVLFGGSSSACELTVVVRDGRCVAGWDDAEAARGIGRRDEALGSPLGFGMPDLWLSMVTLYRREINKESGKPRKTAWELAYRQAEREANWGGQCVIRQSLAAWEIDPVSIGCERFVSFLVVVRRALSSGRRDCRNHKPQTLAWCGIATRAGPLPARGMHCTAKPRAPESLQFRPSTRENKHC